MEKGGSREAQNVPGQGPCQTLKSRSFIWVFQDQSGAIWEGL